MSDLQAVEVAISPVEKFREYLATKAQRLTTERRFIVEEIFADHDHFDVDQIVMRLSQRDDGKRVSRSTVYRTVSALEEAGLLRKIARADGRDLYEHDYGYPQHDHLICRRTGKLIEFHSPELDEILQKVAAEHGFRMEGHRLEVYGLSAEACRPARRSYGKLDRI
ncbi:MAG: transcriptional repressor [Planctomycetaceae bacterium]|nr:transcriptional repressor [Planctomycetaceae bacterium]